MNRYCWCFAWLAGCFSWLGVFLAHGSVDALHGRAGGWMDRSMLCMDGWMDRWLTGASIDIYF